MRTLLYRYARRRLATVAPSTALGRATLYLLVVVLALYLAANLLSWAALAPGWVRTLNGWVVFLAVVLACLGFALLVRWTRERLLWRLRNRLIVTYVFIGVIPVALLVLMVGLAGWVFVGQFATFLATADINAEVGRLEASNSTIAAELAEQLRRGGVSEESLPALQAGAETMAQREITAWFRGRVVLRQPPTAAVPGELPEWIPEEFSGVVLDEGALHLRAIRRVPIRREQLTVMSSAPLDRELLDRVGARLGRITVAPAELVVVRNQQTGELQRTQPRQAAAEQPARAFQPPAQPGQTIRGGTLPRPRGGFDRQVSFPTPLSITLWETGNEGGIPLVVATRISALYERLFTTLGEYANWAVIGLLVVGVVLAVIELVALIIGLRLTRTITYSVAKLYEATQRVNAGDFRHRIQVRSRDQLAALETSFNMMTASLERSIQEQKEKERLQGELAIAQEVQAQLFPKGIADLPTLAVHGYCRPARIVSGDYYDFFPMAPEKLAIAVGDISGKGISAALLMATLHSAVRAYGMEGVSPLVAQHAAMSALQPVMAGGGRAPGGGNGTVSPATILTLLNRHLFLSTSSEKYATLFLGVYDALTRTLTYSNAGHLPPLLLHRDGSVRRLEIGGLVLGLFEDVVHQEREIVLRPGDLFVAFSDGITEPENEFGEFGESRLLEIVSEHRDLPLPRMADTVVTAVQDWVGAGEQFDDITLVLARAR